MSALLLAAMLAATPSVRAAQPTFAETSIIQVADGRGRLNVFAVAADSSVWHFREPAEDGHWLVESLGGRSAGAPSVSFTPQAVMEVWIADPDGALWVNTEKPDHTGWTGWARQEAPPAIDVVSIVDPPRGTTVVVRSADGTLWAGSPRQAREGKHQWLPIGKAASRPTGVFGPFGSEVLYTDAEGRLFSVAFGREAGARALTAPPIRGAIEVALAPTGMMAMARTTSGELIVLQRTAKGWVPGPRLAHLTSMGKASFVALGRSLGVLAKGPGQTFWMSRLADGRATEWVDTGLGSVDEVPGLSVGGRTTLVGRRSLASLAASEFNLQLLSVYVTIDAIEPPDVFDGDTVVVRYTLHNGGSEDALGRVRAFWDGSELEPVGSAFTPPLAPGQRFEGAFTMGPFLHARSGNRKLYVTYEGGDAVERTFAPELGPVVIKDLSQFAEAHETVYVASSTERLPTDDPLLPPGPWSCIPTTSDQQHACGTGNGCTGGNTPQTCPQDCPAANPDIRSYNSLDLCRSSRLVLAPTTIAQIQDAVRAAALAGERVRVVGSQHTSNPLICSEGRVIAMAGLKGAAPPLGTQGSYCQRFDCTASLDDPALPEIDKERQTVRVGPGMNLFALQDFLYQNGLSLGFSVPGFRAATVGGAIATATHGSSPVHAAVISTRVRSLTLVGADGEVREISAETASPAFWKAARVNLGYLGVVVQVRLAVEPAFNLRVKSHWVGFQELLAPGAPQSLVSGCDWGEMVWFPRGGEDDAPVLVLCGTRTNDEGDAENTLLFPPDSDDPAVAFPAVDLMQADACAGRQSCSMEKTRYQVMRYFRPPFTGTDCWQGMIIVGWNLPDELVDWKTHLLRMAIFFTSGFLAVPPSDCDVDAVGQGHRMMSSRLTPPSTRPLERDWEIFVPGQNARAALQVAQAHFKQNQICLPLIGVFLRFAPAEEGTLIAHSVREANRPADDPAGMFFEIPAFVPRGIGCSDLTRYEQVYSDLAERIVSPPIGGRAHWGKNRRSLFQLQRRLGTYGDNMTQFREAVKQADPTGLFANQFGVDIGLRWPQMTKPVPADTGINGCTPAATPDLASMAGPFCGGTSQACCTTERPCMPGLTCRSGTCIAAAAACAECSEREEACASRCNGDPFCECLCSNASCVCRKGGCGARCLLRVCRPS